MSQAWHVEDVALHVRPSPVETDREGWLIRASGGPVRRTNCIGPTPRRSAEFMPVLEAGERLYRRLKRPTIVKVLSIAEPIDEMLERRGYAREAESHVLVADRIADRSRSDAVQIETGDTPDDWIDAWTRIGGPPSAAPFLRASLSVATAPVAYAAYRREGEIVSLAYAMIHRGILGIDAVATKAEERGRGFAGHVVSSLQDWGHRNGASSACL